MERAVGRVIRRKEVTRQEQGQSMQMMDEVDMGAGAEMEQVDIGDTADVLEQPVEIARAVVEEGAPIQEVRRSGRVRGDKCEV